MSQARWMLIPAVGLCIGVVTSQGSVLAQDSPAQQRHAAMEAIRDAMGPIRSIAMGEASFDAATVKKNAEIIAAKLEAAAKLFPEGSGGGETRAKDEIWTDRAGFDAAMSAAHAAAKNLAGVTEAGALEAAMRGLGGSCRDCHTKYRAPEQ